MLESVGIRIGEPIPTSLIIRNSCPRNLWIDHTLTSVSSPSAGVGQLDMAKKKKGQSREPGEPGPSALWLLSEDNPLRRCTRFLIEWPPFEFVVLVTIIANCVVLALEEHLPKGDRTPLAQKLVSNAGMQL